LKGGKNKGDKTKNLTEMSIKFCLLAFNDINMKERTFSFIQQEGRAGVGILLCPYQAPTGFLSLAMVSRQYKSPRHGRENV